MKAYKNVQQDNLSTAFDIKTNVFMNSVPSLTTTPLVVETKDTKRYISEVEVNNYIYQKFGSRALTALCIASREDGAKNGFYDAYANNDDSDGSFDTGIFQINSVHHIAISILRDWKQNTDNAYRLSSGGTNWNPWSTKHYCI